MCQNLPPDGKLDEAGTRKPEDGRPCKPIAPQSLFESSIGTRHQSQSSRRFAETSSAVNFGDSCFCVGKRQSQRTDTAMNESPVNERSLILAVDDDPDQLELVSHILRRAGFTVTM